MSNTHQSTVLLMDREGGTSRVLLHQCAPADERERSVRYLLEACGVPIISASHLYAIVAGPEHPDFATAATALGFTPVAGCNTGLAKRAMEFLVMAELLPPSYADDGIMLSVLELTFALDSDWEDLAGSAVNAARMWCSDNLQAMGDRNVQAAIFALTGGICTAMTAARAGL